MKELVMQGATMIKPVEANDCGKFCAAYQNYPESIGYCLLSFFENDGYRLGSEVKILSIDGVQPNEASIRNGTYPYATNFYAAIRKGEEDDNGGRFLEWILSDEGQACIRQSGYLPLH
jgi:phosphate transport system substrate-binding protein